MMMMSILWVLMMTLIVAPLIIAVIDEELTMRGELSDENWHV